MRAALVNSLLLTLTLIIASSHSQAQEESTTIYQSKRYLDINLKSLHKYNARVEKQQKKLLNKLKKKEKRYAAKLQKKDSAAYVRYQRDGLTYDSISKLNPATASVPRRIKSKTGKTIDSLKGVKSYLEQKTHRVNAGTEKDPQLGNYDAQLSQANEQLNYNSYINELIGQRTNKLKSLSSSSKDINGLKGIQKNVFYSGEKIKAYKDIADEPSRLEEKALEYLQGQQGFDDYLAGSPDPNSMQALAAKGTSVSDLEKMGYQTKRQLSQNLSKKFGNNLSGIQDKMGTQVTDWKDKTQDVKKLKNNYKQTRRSISQLRHTDKPDFRVNPMRGLPFWQRIEKQYNWQTTRATIGGQPAILQLAAMAGFMHTPRLTYGLGATALFGLGQNWNNIRFSFQGIGLRSYATWQWQYGIGAYAGYERTWKQAVFSSTAETPPPALHSPHNTNTYNDAILIGLTKSYRISDKWNGFIQVLYDVWWKDKGLRSPIQLRLSTISK